MQDECPIVCKAEKCRDKWIDSVKTADTTGTTETDYGTEIFEMHFETQGEHINFHHKKKLNDPEIHWDFNVHTL